MATHFVCQSTEPLAHRYPSGLGGKSHGAVSQYEVYNSVDKRHTQFPPPGWDFSLTSEEDSLPLLASAPQAWKNASFQPDPDLCLTPQKNSEFALKPSVASRKPVQKTEFTLDPLLALTPDKRAIVNEFEESDALKAKGRKQRVRFDIQSQSEASADESGDAVICKNLKSHSPRKTYDKPYQPEIYGNESDTEDVMLEKAKEALGLSEDSRRVGYTVGKSSKQAEDLNQKNVCDQATFNQKEADSASRQSSLSSLCRTSNSKPGSNERKIVTKHNTEIESAKSNTDKVTVTNADPIAACRASEPPGPKRRVKVLRESQPGPTPSGYTFPFNSDPSEYTGGEEHLFARPEFSSTLRMKVAAEKLKESEVDVEKALQKKLKMSENTRTEINEKALSHVNAEGTVFSGLVCLSLPAEEICKEAAELKTARAKPAFQPKSKTKDKREPDLLEFYTSDRQKESVSHALSGLPPRPQTLATASNWRAFDLYKHSRVWEGRGTKQ